jgi:large subunit ribosomal protein L1
MAKKAELIEEAKKLKLKVGNQNTIAEIEAAIKAAGVAVEEIQKEKVAKTTAAKAGKRSVKALHKTEAIAAKEERKTSAASEETADKPKTKKPAKPPRSRLERRGKKFREVAKLIEKDKLYALADAIELAIKTSPTKFDASVELHVNLNVDPKQSDQMVRDTLLLPSGTGKNVRVAVFTDDKIAGAVVSGIDAITDMLDKGKMDFDVLIATPASMPKLGKYARILGPRGLMPNPKSGTVTIDIAKALNEAKTGRVEYRVDSTGIIHLAIGKVSAGKDKVLDNAQAVMTSIRNNKPASVKSGYIKSIHLTTSMGPSIRASIE